MKEYYTSHENKSCDTNCNCSDLPSVEAVQETSGFSRRSFLKTTGFSFAAFMVACSKTPVQKAIPFLIQPEEILPGKATWYASTSFACDAGCGVHVKNRDGRPIKLEGNPKHPMTQGGLCAQCQASLIELYDSKRIIDPILYRQSSTWEAVDSYVIKELRKIRDKGKEIVILTGTATSPSLLYTIKKFKKKFKTVSHIQMDDYSYSAILDAHEKNYGQRILPKYRFDKADLILSIDADFLGSWVSPIQFTKDFQKNRKLDSKHISKLIQVESRMSITGAKADERIAMTPTEMKSFMVDLDAIIHGKHGTNSHAKKIAGLLKLHRGNSLVVSGINDIKIQLIVNRINQSLGNVGRTLDIKKTSQMYAGSDSSIQSLVTKIESGMVGALLISDTNPAYILANGIDFSTLMKQVDLSVSFSDMNNETTAHCNVIAPGLHDLESWNDSELTSGVLSMTQPVIRPFGKNRSLRQSLSTWMGMKQDERDLVRNYWKKIFTSRVKSGKTFTRFWNELVHDGFTTISPNSKKLTPFKNQNIQIEGATKNELELVLFQSSQLGHGRHAENPWLQELPDPITKLTWDNVASFSPETAEKYHLKKGDVIEIVSGKNKIELPVFLQPGQKNNTVVAALGYGRVGTERFHEIGPDWLEKKDTVKKGETVGTSVSSMISFDNTFHYSGMPIKIQKTERTWDLALTQTYNTLSNPENTSPASMPVRPFVQETTFSEFQKNPSAGSHHGHPITTLWEDDHTYEGHHWGMAIDLTSCTGCSSCIVGCQVENNVPVVGKDEVLRKRDMAWLRMDRYYSGDGEDVDVSFQAMMCQHCDNAPCEPVCPVLATVHSSEGLNQQVYNRCVGTRFCANNCPYKVRRFNWFDYAHEDVMENMVLNPDVTVRSRGVMEKCSLCVQRIQEAKFEAKRLGVPLKDGDIKLACEQSCPADAIVFGDLNNPESRISKMTKDERHYKVLEELNAVPTVGYLTQVRNRDADKEKGGHHG
ncbi:MAG: 4Fe-4S dicluster domain-containing protein [Candidatus Marinimicrobia bacterium]|jgi:molybdopterin-containing oxidoreductase family iron-sulfur binding subunit|nr:4Fe-4S dicluster domain-containing protein [Candidatus Neomarinimicrobiota bacterium]MBT4068822.1 4Fe-4S dicluster domain-containing protein [Candidatus Neomarinimicrobiota bacterium]MBT6418138.1 4Fe-4S dicluster domain-containing protein [Candidatus Neomarinimicrobiota bacterium]